MEYIEIVLWQDGTVKLEEVIETLEGLGLKYKSAKRIKEDMPLPPLTTQAKNFTKAVVGHVKSGLSKASNEVYEKRLETCRSCNNMRSDSRCSNCGCNIKIKASWHEQTCPLNKW